MSENIEPRARGRRGPMLPLLGGLVTLILIGLLLWFLFGGGGGPGDSRAAVKAPETDRLSPELNAVMETGATLVGAADGNVAILEVPDGPEGDDIRQSIDQLGTMPMPDADGIHAVDTLIVTYQDGALPPATTKQVVGLPVVERFEPGSYLALGAPQEGISRQLLQQLDQEEGVEHLELDLLVGLPVRARSTECGSIQIKKASTCPGACPSTRRPNDPDLARQWGYDSVRAHCVRSLEYDRRVVVALLDSGVTLDHPDLVGRWWVNAGEVAGNGIDDDGNGFADDVHGWDFVDGDATPQDTYGHGTRMAGVIAAATDDATGMAGVAVSVEVMPLRWAATSSRMSVRKLVGAIYYAIEAQADILNMSFGSDSRSWTLLRTLRRAEGAGLLTVCAAGNQRRNVDRTPRYPACYTLPSILSVCAIDSRENIWSALPGMGSNWGARSVDVAAPGSCIWTTVRTGVWDWDMGTSIATAHASAAAAVIWGTRAFSAQTYASVLSELLTNARSLSSLAGKCATRGTVDLAFLCP